MINKAIIPAAGFGTRFLPASKSQPKEMLPVIDKPTIQYVVEEAVSSGITDILMIIGKGKRAIEEHFDRSFELEKELESKNKKKELKTIRAISNLANIHFIWQKELNGLGDAVSYARHHVGNDPFAVLLGDTITKSKSPVTKQLINIYNRYQESVVALDAVDMEIIHRYGVIGGKEISENLYLVDKLVEKPSKNKAPSNLVIAGRYIFTPEIFDCIDKIKPGKNNEIQLTDAMQLLLSTRAVYGLRYIGKRYDIGNKLDFLKTNIEFGLERKDFGKELKQYIKDIAKKI